VNLWDFPLHSAGRDGQFTVVIAGSLDTCRRRRECVCEQLVGGIDIL